MVRGNIGVDGRSFGVFYLFIYLYIDIGIYLDLVLF